MADRHTIENQLDQNVDTLVKAGTEFVLKRVGPREQFEVDDADMSPAMNDQIENGIFKVISTATASPPVPAIMGVTAEQKDALNGANSPSTSNVFATADDLEALETSLDMSADEIDALNAASSPSGTNPFATVDDLTPLTYTNPTFLVVDGNRTETYVADGSFERPYKTIAAAVSNASARATILVLGGTYAENVTLPNQVSLFGMGVGATSITGNLVTGTANCQLRDFDLAGNITIQGTSSVINVYCVGTATITADCQSWNFTIMPSTSGVAALISSGSLVTFDACTLESSGDINTVTHTAGKLVFNTVQLNGDEATKAVVKSTGGMLVVGTSFVVNSGGGDSVSCNNGATTAPNAIVDAIIAGNVEAGSAATIAADVYGTGQVNGTSIVPKVTGSN